jgi:DNA-directed RNA polymerase subunit RPC12/RpoP
MDSPEEKIIVFRAYDTVVEANLAKTKLDAYGIPCFLTEEHMTSLYPIRNGIFPGTRLHIFEKDHDQVKDVLDGHQVEGYIKCPRCGSFDFHKVLSGEQGSSFFLRAIREVFSSTPTVQYKCENCHHIYTPD